MNEGRVASQTLREDLEGDRAGQRKLFGFVNNPHSTMADLFDNLMQAYYLTDHG